MLHFDAMKPAYLRRHLPSLVPPASVIVVVLLACASIFVAVGASTVSAAEASLTVRVDSTLGPVDKSLIVDVTGQVSQSLSRTRLVVTFVGPVAPEQVGQTAVDAKPAYQASWWLGGAPADGSGAGTPVLSRSDSSTAQELANGQLEAMVTISAGSVPTPGAYLTTVEVLSGSEVLASGSSWVGRVAVRATPLDVSFVLPVFLGIHRDDTGTFYDQVLEDATLPVESGGETLRALAPVMDQLPTWQLTLAIEPILLTQLRDMADGFTYIAEDGEKVDVDANDLAAQNAAATVSDVVELAALDSVEIVASPYTGADLDLLAAQGWRDGLESLQMGKEELQTTLGIEAPLSGAYVPGLDIIGASFSYYADASIEYVVVGSDIQASLSEVPAAGTVAVRAENSDNGRVTLMFAGSALSTVIGYPWDANVFNAALAAELARTSPEGLVIAPAGDYGLMPAEYVQRIGQILTSQEWIRTLTLEDLLDLYPADSRPLLLGDSDTSPDGYIAGQLWDAILAAHPAVSDLSFATAADSGAPVQASRLLYTAQSRWWARSDTSPQEASIGLAYAEEAQVQAEAELGKVTFAKSGSAVARVDDDTVRVSIQNDADYVVKAEVRLSGEDLTFPDGDTVDVELQPGRVDVEVAVVSEGDSDRLRASLLVGDTVVDEYDQSLSSLGLWSILPWVIAVAVLLAGTGVYVLLRKRPRKAPGSQSG